jgi:hypothetical protein
LHGNQEGAFFNTYYKGVCYAPLYIFCGHHLLVAKLRSSNVSPAAGALEELQRVDYAIAMATNSQLKLRATDVIEKAKLDYERKLEPVTALMETLFSPGEKLEKVAELVTESIFYRLSCLSTLFTGLLL